MQKVVLCDAAADIAKGLRRTGFCEIYWADVPREVVRQADTLEETKAWTRTIVARVGAIHRRAQAHGLEHAKRVRGAPQPPDFSLVGEVLEEVVETIYVLDRILSIARKAGVFEFDLRQLLEDYLGDVQIVTEFSDVRGDILGRFHRALEQVHHENPEARLHLVAHSEGTVIAFLGLLHAMKGRRLRPVQGDWHDPYEGKADGDALGWLGRVRGFMTLGSPIDKHLILWPQLFQGLGGSGVPASRIAWRNYYDYGDPVGFELDTTREWLRVHRPDAFDFRPEHDVGFARYMLAGKAHNDYWGDSEVFEHFVSEVVVPLQSSAAGLTRPPPKNRRFVRFLSPAVPHLFSFLVLWLGTYILYSAANSYLSPQLDSAQRAAYFYMVGSVPAALVPPSEIFRNALCVTVLLAGITLFARIPRLASAARWRVGAWIALVIGLVAYLGVSERERDDIGLGFVALSKVGLWFGDGRLALDGGVMAIAVGMGFVGRLSLRRSKVGPGGLVVGPREQRWILRGMRPLLLAGVAGIGFLVVAQTAFPSPSLRGASGVEQQVLAPDPSAWPLLLAGAAFLYLWWLAALLFGLAFVWQRYVRKSLALQQIQTWARASESTDGEGSSDS